MSTILAVDPGVNGTGFAVFRTNAIAPPVSWGVYIPPRGLDFVPRCMLIRNKIEVVQKSHNMDCTFIEYPAYFGTVSGQMVAARGDLVKLAFLVGLIAGCGDFQLVPVNKWKGQLPKDVVISRIKKILGTRNCPFKTHAWDAVGIGLYVLGRFR